MGMKDKKLVIFDLDGTLLDTSIGLNECMNIALKEFDLPTITVEQTKQFVGNGIFNYVNRACNFSPLAERVLPLYNDVYNRLGFEKTTPYCGVNGLIGALKGKNLKLAILSNKPHEATLIAYERFFKQFNFDGVYGGKPEFGHKPDPALLLKLLNDLKTEKQDALLIGDSEADVLTAKNAGVDCIAVDWGFRSRNQLEEAGATNIASTAEEVLNLIL